MPGAVGECGLADNDFVRVKFRIFFADHRNLGIGKIDSQRHKAFNRFVFRKEESVVSGDTSFGVGLMPKRHICVGVAGQVDRRIIALHRLRIVNRKPSFVEFEAGFGDIHIKNIRASS